MRLLRVICVIACCAVAAWPALAAEQTPHSALAPKRPTRDRLAHVDSVRDSLGIMVYRVRCTDITVHIRDGRWFSSDSAMFFSEHHKVQVASSILRARVDYLRDSLRALTDSAGALIAQRRYTREGLDSTVTGLQSVLEKNINTHNYSLRRLEDYQTTLNAVRPLLRADSH